jgi:membrane-associated phospholipid phosphatase
MTPENINATDSIPARLQSKLALKIALLVGLNLWVYVPYLLLQQHHFRPATIMTAGYLDRLIPFSDLAIWPYLSIYVFMPGGPFLLNERRPILRYATGIVLIGVIADVIFIFWPTTCPRLDAPGSNIAYRLIVAIDNPYHAFPSLHAAFAVYSASWGGPVLRALGDRGFWRIGIWLWCFLILYATLATKQHMTADIIAGSALGYGVYAGVFWDWRSIFKRKPDPRDRLRA